jgi:tetratricopeptide (TPR) repeat protein
VPLASPAAERPSFASRAAKISLLAPLVAILLAYVFNAPPTQVDPASARVNANVKFAMAITGLGAFLIPTVAGAVLGFIGLWRGFNRGASGTVTLSLIGIVLNCGLVLCLLVAVDAQKTIRAHFRKLNDQAIGYAKQGDYVRAETLLRQAVESTKLLWGESHPDYATSLNNLGMLYYNQREYGRAEPLLRQASEIRKKVLGESHPHYAQSLSNLGMLYCAQGHYAWAEPLFRQALEIRKKALGENHPDYATSLNYLSFLYYSQRDYARAEPLCRQALEIRKKALGENHPDYVQSLNNLAALYKAQGDQTRAALLTRQAVEISDRQSKPLR